MPDAPHPDPDEDDLDTNPPPPPVFYAEQALLGALLLEPHRLTDVTGTIEPASFSVHAHGTLFAAIRDLPAPDPARHATEIHWLNTVLDTSRPQAPGLTASYLHRLVQICPWPRHAPAYARMIEAEHDRRLLRIAAQRLAQTAQDASLPYPVLTILAEADTLASVADSIATKYPPHPGPLPRTPPPPPATLHDGEALDEERLLLATATAHPGSITPMRWLTPGDFTHPPHAGVWECLAALARRRAAIDPVTVLWEVQQRGLLAAGHDPQNLLGLLAEPVGSPEHWGERILQRSVLATAHHVARRIEAFTDDPATAPYQLVIGSRRALADMFAVRTRWHHATSPAPATRATRARSTAPPRADPPQTAAPHATRLAH